MLLKKLSELNGASGDEKAVRDKLKKLIENDVDSFFTDKIGNLIATKKGSSSRPKVLLAAHMDEIALMIIEITGDGFLKFRPVGAIDSRILVSKPVKINEKIFGIIGSKAIHLQKSNERLKKLDFEHLYIDIGAKSKEEAVKNVGLGDYAYFDTEFELLGENCYKGKALDDRVGCSILVEILKKNYQIPLIAAFTVQEEVGLRGAKVASYHTEPDFAIVIEGTMAADTMNREEAEWITELGKGPALSIIDRTTLYDPKLLQKVREIAHSKNISLQLRRGSSGGNDAGRIHLSKGGIQTITLSVPCRYLHSPASLIYASDYQACLDLVDELLKYLGEEDIYANK